MNPIDLLLWAQAGPPRFGPGPRPGPSGPPPDAGAAIGILLAFMACMGLMTVLTLLPMIIGMWKTYAKAGEPGWASLVPFYNFMVLARIAGRSEIEGLLAALLPGIGIIFLIMILVDLCAKFRKGTGFLIGLLLFPFIFWPILGFGSAQYVGSNRRGRPSRYEEEEEDDRPRRRRRDEEEEDYEEDTPRRSRTPGDPRLRKRRDEVD